MVKFHSSSNKKSIYEVNSLGGRVISTHRELSKAKLKAKTLALKMKRAYFIRENKVIGFYE